MESHLKTVVTPEHGNEPRPIDLLTVALEKVNAIHSRAAPRDDGATRADCLVAVGALRSLKKAISPEA